jgi:Na+-driven multidrug efflux pump
MLYNFGSSILRAVGETKKPLKYLTLAGVVNVILNLILVIFFHLDVAGVAIATIVSQAISALLVIRHLTKRTDVVRLNIKKLKIDLKALGAMVYIGLPAGVQGILFSISNVVIQSSINSFDSTAIVAGNTASHNVEGFVYVSMNAFYQASLTFTGQNYGAKKIENCKKVLLYSLLCVFVSGFVLGVIGYLFGDTLLNLYTDGTESIGFGKIRMSIIMTTYFLCGIMDVAVGALRGFGKSIVPTIVTILGVCVFRLVWIYTVFETNHTLEVLYSSYPISWLVTGGIHIISFILIYKHYKKKIYGGNI